MGERLFDVRIISTGSKGNCVVLDDAIMCDAGLTRKKVIDSGYNLEHLRYLFVSHKHHDHTNLPFIRWAIENGVEVHIPEAVIEMLCDEGRINIDDYVGDNVFSHHPTDIYETDIEYEGLQEHIRVELHPQKHHDITNYAFVFEKTNGDTDRLLYSTDLDTVEPTDIGPGLVNLGMFNTIVMEGNFDEVWLREYISLAVDSVDPNVESASMSDADLNSWVRQNYRQLPKDYAAGLFRAVQNMRHLSKQQARLYVRNHLLPGGRYYEVHRSSKFYEKPSGWES